ncbi:alpha/beta fold hydrolase [Paracoccus sp. (in: a-proteobacteria)]|uniref:alpha/beta fold hydrolase n=1 Tax=Paracoccus sp. TaxID=267 RepID=UPI003A858684
MIRPVLIPGLLSDGVVWQDLAPLLGPGTVCAHPVQDDRIPDMAARILTQVPGEIVAIGHSMGGRIAMDMARQAPDRLRGLVLISTGHNGGTTAELPKRQARIALAHDSMEKLADDWLPPMVAPARQGDAALMGVLRQMVLRHDAQIHERQIHALINRPDAAVSLPRITCPVLLLVGDQDGWSPVTQHKEMAAMTPDATLRVIAGAGHFLPLEKSAGMVSAILGWLDEKGLSHGKND